MDPPPCRVVGETQIREEQRRYLGDEEVSRPLTLERVMLTRFQGTS